MRKDAGMVDSEEFERVRADICASGPASDGDNLLGIADERFLAGGLDS